MYEQKLTSFLQRKTNMMWSSQNFLLCNRNIIKMKVTEWKKKNSMKNRLVRITVA